MKNLIKRFIPPFLLDWYHLSLSFLGAVLYGFPSRKLKVIGVTGTNGKSTVVHLTTKILEEAGLRVASLSSIKFKIGDREWANSLKMTMPGRLKLQKFLRQAVKERCQYAVLEVTSEGIKQHRHRLINFDVAVFTNLTPEHIESHGSFEKYRKAKGKLFQACRGVHIINRDDSSAEYFLQFPAQKKILYSIKDKTLVLQCTKLLGEFNIYNALAAIQVGLSQGIDLETCQKALEKIRGIPGRLEIVIPEPFTVIVDYAHTPDALEKVYQAINTLTPKPHTLNPRMICVLGATGGGRDKWKRPELGRIAAKYCNKVVLTNEDPYDENPYQIIEDIKQGALQTMPWYNLYTLADRRKAIGKALDLAKAGDVVIITGKGCEPWMCVEGGRKLPWDEKSITLDMFAKRGKYGIEEQL